MSVDLFLTNPADREAYDAFASKLELKGMAGKARVLWHLYAYHVSVLARVRASCLVPRKIFEGDLLSLLPEFNRALGSLESVTFEEVLAHLSLPPLELLGRRDCVSVLRRLEKFFLHKLNLCLEESQEAELRNWVTEVSPLMRELHRTGVPEAGLGQLRFIRPFHRSLEVPATLLLLGAGASFAAGMPLVRDLTDSSFVRSLLRRYAFQLNFNRELGDEHIYLFNQIAARLDTMLGAGSTVEDWLESEVVTEQEVFEYVNSIFVVCQIFAEQRKGTVQYLRLLQALPALNCHSVVTLNTDICIDRALFDLGPIAGDSHRYSWESPSTGLWNYGVLFDTVDKSFPSYVHSFRALDFSGQTTSIPCGDSLTLLKPHGSFNWGLCRSCGLLSYNGPTPFLPDSPIVCPRCSRGALGSGYIPPYEQGETPLFRALQNSTAAAIETAQRVIVVGYSFPSYDHDIWGVMERVAKRVEGKLANGSPELVFVDPFPPKGSIDRLRRLGYRVHVEALSMTEWLGQSLGVPEIDHEELSETMIEVIQQREPEDVEAFHRFLKWSSSSNE